MWTIQGKGEGGRGGSLIRITPPQHHSASPILHTCSYTIIMSSNETAKDSSFSAGQSEDSIEQRIKGLATDMSKMSKEDVDKYFQMFRATLFGDQEPMPADEEEEDYQKCFSKNAFGDDGEKKLRRKWMASESAEDRKKLAVERWRVMFRPSENSGPSLKDLGHLERCAKMSSRDGWDGYMNVLSWTLRMTDQKR